MNLKSIVVSNKPAKLKRKARLYLFDTTCTSDHLSELELDDISEIFEDVEILISQNNSENYIEWGVDLFSVISDAQVSKCRNDIEGIQLEDVSTISLLLFLKELENFKKKYSEPIVLKSIIGKAFEIMKNKPLDFKKWVHANDYEIQVDGVTINLNLSKDDFEYSVIEFLNEIEEGLD